MSYVVDGAAGLKRDLGVVGDKGGIGDAGAKGQVGTMGYQGVSGSPGAAGSDGAAGLKGDLGVAGDEEGIGEDGEKGEVGVQGVRSRRSPDRDWPCVSAPDESLRCKGGDRPASWSHLLGQQLHYDQQSLCRLYQGMLSAVLLDDALHRVCVQPRVGELVPQVFILCGAQLRF